MSVRSFQEVVPEQATTFTAAVSFVLFAYVGLHGLNNLRLLATTTVNSTAEWVVTVTVTTVVFGVAMLSLAFLDRHLEVSG